MRFLFYDRVLELEAGRRMRARKCVGLADEYLTGHFERRPVVPAPILIESMAQVGGWLVNATEGFRRSAVMSLVRDVTLHTEAGPGSVLEITAELVELSDDFARASCVVTEDGRTVARLGAITYALYVIRDPREVRGEAQRFRGFAGWPQSRMDALMDREVSA